MQSAYAASTAASIAVNAWVCDSMYSRPSSRFSKMVSSMLEESRV